MFIFGNKKFSRWPERGSAEGEEECSLLLQLEHHGKCLIELFFYIYMRSTITKWASVQWWWKSADETIEGCTTKKSGAPSFPQSACQRQSLQSAKEPQRIWRLQIYLDLKHTTTLWHEAWLFACFRHDQCQNADRLLFISKQIYQPRHYQVFFADFNDWFSQLLR